MRVLVFFSPSPCAQRAHTGEIFPRAARGWGWFFLTLNLTHEDREKKIERELTPNDSSFSPIPSFILSTTGYFERDARKPSGDGEW